MLFVISITKDLNQENNSIKEKNPVCSPVKQSQETRFNRYSYYSVIL